MKRLLCIGILLICLGCEKTTEENQIPIEQKTDSTTISGSRTVESYIIRHDITDTIGGKEVGLVVCEIEPSIDPEQLPQFLGGLPALSKFIKKNIQWPRTSSATNKLIFISFLVQTDGSITDIKVLRGIDKLHDEEAIRVVKLMPKWKPGRMDNLPILMSSTILFRVEDDPKK